MLSMGKGQLDALPRASAIGILVSSRSGMVVKYCTLVASGAGWELAAGAWEGAREGAREAPRHEEVEDCLISVINMSNAAGKLYLHLTTPGKGGRTIYR